MKSKIPVGTEVTYNCPVLGSINGTVTKYIRCISNGQQHAIIDLADYSEPITAPVSEIAKA